MSIHAQPRGTKPLQVQSDFQAWLKGKRLVIVHEIYQGHGWKAYNALKSRMTEKNVTVNEKFQQPVTLENYIHIVACSNSLQALKVDDDDRRWHICSVAEKAWPRWKFDTFFAWLQAGGLGAIKRWALEFGEYIQTGKRPPLTSIKREMIEESASDHIRYALNISAPFLEDAEPLALSTSVMRDLVKSALNEKLFDQPNGFCKALQARGWKRVPGKIHYRNNKHVVLVNQAAMDALGGLENPSVGALKAILDDSFDKLRSRSQEVM